MKIILTSDLDHITYTEHFTDLYLPKRLTEIIISNENITFKLKRIKAFIIKLFKNQLNNTKDFINFHKDHNIPITYFVAVNKGKSLSYSNRNLLKIYDKYLKECNVFLHGTKYEEYNQIKDEYYKFENLFNYKSIGIRMHYLQKNSNTDNHFSKLYLFDSSRYANYGLCTHNKMIIFPINIMDVYEFRNTEISENVLDQTIIKLKQAEIDNNKFFVINFHDVYF